MATYKLIQDIEADDHILGPLTLRQFIFALVTAFLLYLDFLCVVKGVVFLLVGLLPPTVLTAFFAAPIHGDQPTEVWALAKLRFYFKPRQRLWNQSGVKELVTITVPKKIERVYTDGLSQVEVKSRLKALANTIDSRGWAVKNVGADEFINNPVVDTNSDRLLGVNDMPQAVPDEEQPVSYDMFDTANSPVAQQLDTMMDESARARRQTLLDQMSTAVITPTTTPQAAGSVQQQTTPQQTAYWFAQPLSAGMQVQPIAPMADNSLSAADEQALDDQLKQKASAAHTSYHNMRTLLPAGAQAQVAQQQPQASVPAPQSYAQPTGSPTPTSPAILSLANNNNLSVATLAREAQRSKGDDEVVVSLH